MHGNYPNRKRPTASDSRGENPAEKPVLAVSRVPVYRVHYKTLEAYITKVFGFEFDFLIAAGVVEGLAVDYQATGKFSSIAWENRANELRCGRRTREVSLILNTLVADGFIAAGQYTVSTHQLPDPIDVYKSLLTKTRTPLSPVCIQFKEKNPSVQSKLAYIDKVWLERNGSS